MILVDSSVWIDHLRQGDAKLVRLLEDSQVLSHPAVIGELALGRLTAGEEILGLLGNLPRVTVATDAEVLDLIATRPLSGLGIGFVDAHLLAATLLTPRSSLWTRDKRLHAVSAEMRLAHEE